MARNKKINKAKAPTKPQKDPTKHSIAPSSPNPPNRPTLYTHELAEEICDVIAESITGLKTLCEANPHWPKVRTIRTWIRENKDFQHMYARAKEDQSDLLAEEIIEIADDSSRDTKISFNKQGDEYESCDHEWINRSRLRVDSRKWLAAKLKPKVYGDKVVNELSGLNGAPIEYANLTPEARNARIAEILETARNRRANDPHLSDGETKETDV